MGEANGGTGGTGVNVGNSVAVGIPVAPGVGVHVAGSVTGAALAWGCGTAAGPHEARSRMMNNAPGISFFCKRSPSLIHYFSTASLNAQSARMTVIGANTRFSKEAADAIFPSVFNIIKMKINHMPALITPRNPSILIYNAHGHKLRFPTFKKAQFVTALGIVLASCWWW